MIDFIAAAEATRAESCSVVSSEDRCSLRFGTVTTSTLASCSRLAAPAKDSAAAWTASSMLCSTESDHSASARLGSGSGLPMKRTTREDWRPKSL